MLVTLGWMLLASLPLNRPAAHRAVPPYEREGGRVDCMDRPGRALPPRGRGPGLLERRRALARGRLPGGHRRPHPGAVSPGALDRHLRPGPPGVRGDWGPGRPLVPRGRRSRRGLRLRHRLATSPSTSAFITAGDYWDYRLIDGGRIRGDPYVSLTDLAARLVPDGDYDYDVTPYYVDQRYDYPRFVCYDCHAYASYDEWDPYLASCTRYRVVIRDDPRYYPYRYGGRNVVAERPAHPGPRFVFRDADPLSPAVSVGEPARRRGERTRTSGAPARISVGAALCPRHVSSRFAIAPARSRPSSRQRGRSSTNGAGSNLGGTARMAKIAGRRRAGTRTARARGSAGLQPSTAAPRSTGEPELKPAATMSRTVPLYSADVCPSTTSPGILPMHRLPRFRPGRSWPGRSRPSPARPTRAAASITAADVARRIGIIADDSMLGRDTPSRGLELTAQVRRRPVPPLRAPTRRRQRDCPAALSDQAAAVRCGIPHGSC